VHIRNLKINKEVDYYHDENYMTGDEDILNEPVRDILEKIQ